MLKLKRQSFGHLMWRTDLLEKTLMLAKIEGRRRSGWQRMRWLDDMTDSVNMSFSKFRALMMDRKAWYPGVHGVTKSRTWLSNWTELKTSMYYFQVWYSASASVFCSLSWCDSVFLVPTIFQPKLLRWHPQYYNIASQASFSKLGTVKIVHSQKSKIIVYFADVSLFEALNLSNLI